MTSYDGGNPGTGAYRHVPVWVKIFGTGGIVGLMVALVAVLALLNSAHAWPFGPGSGGPAPVTKASATPTTQTSGKARPGTVVQSPSVTGYISVSASPQRQFTDVPNPSSSQTLAMTKCQGAPTSTFPCYPLDTAPADNNSGMFYNNQLWGIAATRQPNGTYLTTIGSDFSGNWTYSDGSAISSSGGEYLSYVGLSSGSHEVALVPLSGHLGSSGTAGNPDQYWILTPESGGTWELSPWEDPEGCLTKNIVGNNGGDPLVLACQSGDASQQWTISTTQS